MGWTTFSIAFDLHGDQCHRPSVKAFHKFNADFKPQRRIVGGDVWDFPRWREGASGRDLKRQINPDFDAGIAFIEKFRPDTVLLGNHDRRMWRAAECEDELAAERIADLKKKQKELGFALLPYSKSRVIQLGPLKVLHGFFAGETAAKRHAQVYGPAIFGHVHTGERASAPRHGERHEAWSSPALCRLDFEYAEEKPSTLKWENGWIYGAFNGRRYHVETATMQGGTVMVASGFREIAA